MVFFFSTVHLSEGALFRLEASINRIVVVIMDVFKEKRQVDSCADWANRHELSE